MGPVVEGAVVEGAVVEGAVVVRQGRVQGPGLVLALEVLPVLAL